ncbi:hypothetical protein ABT390_33750 [Streptomyces aurantiacus]|uniref:Uncharacterized protein n=1 Tax=Streptomyces aurantiacus JA 4570 TaxID=1286094 RepID=S3ZTZ8_9ACTN|nr:hypothetical protein [Streptomyces aurantiacus]EPH46916.1 hypothetical protein STRAU_0082 [Streptomyces aurantiacus JA 4570]
MSARPGGLGAATGHAARVVRRAERAAPPTGTYGGAPRQGEN